MFSYKNLRVCSVAIPLLAAGCADGTGPTTGTVNVMMQQSSAVALAANPGPSFVTASPMSAVAPDQVTSLVLIIEEVQFLPVVEDTVEGQEPEEAAWVSVAASDLTIDLMALPTDAETPQQVAVGELPVGAYSGVRFVVTSATIVFSSTLTVGNTQFVADAEHAVKVPSGVIKTDLALDVVAGEGEGQENTASLLFGPDASFQNLTATGNGQVILNPVLKAKLPPE